MDHRSHLFIGASDGHGCIGPDPTNAPSHSCADSKGPPVERHAVGEPGCTAPSAALALAPDQMFGPHFDMPERDGDYGTGLAELMNPEVARNPQPIYSVLHASSPVFRLDGVGVIVSTRAGLDELLRDPELFSSGVSAHDLKTKRPLIPLQIDPPEHRKYRRILDRLFAPQRMKLLEDSTTQLVNELIDQFTDDSEVDFSKQFSTPSRPRYSSRSSGFR